MLNDLLRRLPEMATIFGMGRQAYRTRRPRLAAALVAAVTLLSPACASRRFDALMESWEGNSSSDLLRTWGQPDFLYGDGQGGRVAVYVPSAATRPARSSPESARVRAASGARVYQADMKNSWPTFRIFATLRPTTTSGSPIRPTTRGGTGASFEASTTASGPPS